ncbi:MAG: hypothetical protein QME76_01125 [Bacillota bacterium]|nr:hypothetical protein [Bacillota bacterium]
MTGNSFVKDMVVLVSDRNIEFAVKGILNRCDALNIRQITNDFFVHPEHDPGCRLRAHDFLRGLIRRYKYALVVLDREGCGSETPTRKVLEKEIEQRLAISGWNGRAAAVVIDPELEVWVWSNSPHVERILGWAGMQPDLRTWLSLKGYLRPGELKPRRPKEAVQQALYLAGKARSSSLYQRLAQNVSLTRCVDPAFVKLKLTLRSWFPA